MIQNVVLPFSHLFDEFIHSFLSLAEMYEYVMDFVSRIWSASTLPLQRAIKANERMERILEPSRYLFSFIVLHFV